MREWFIESFNKFLESVGYRSLVNLLIILVVLLLLGLWRKAKMRPLWIGLTYFSYIFGAVTWVLCAVVTYVSFGWLGLIIGLFIIGLGVVPIGIAGAFFKLHMIGPGLFLCGMVIATLAARVIGVYFIGQTEDESDE